MQNLDQKRLQHTPVQILGTMKKLALAIAYTHHAPSSSLLLLTILPTQNNKSVKVPFTHNVQKNTSVRMGSHVKYSTHLCLMLYVYLPFDSVLSFMYITCNGALTFS